MNVSSLAYRLTADASDLGRELRFAERDIKRFQRRAESDFLKLGKAFATVGTVAVGALAAMTREGINFAAEMNEVGRELQIATDEVSRLKVVGEETDVSFNVLTRRMDRFNRQIIAARNGTGDLADILSRYNIELDVSGDGTVSQIDLMAELADVVAATEDPFERLEIATAAFGSRGSEMIKMLEVGGDEFRRLMGVADETGRVIDTQTGVAAQQLQANMRELRAVVHAFSIGLAQQTVPTLAAYSGALADTANRSNDVTQATPPLTKGLQIALATVEGLRIGFVVLSEVLAANAAMALETGKRYASAFGQGGLAGVASTGFSDLVAAFTDGEVELQEGSQDFSGKIEAIYSGLFDELDGIYLQGGKNLNAIFDGVTSDLENSASGLDLASIFEENIVEMEEVTSAGVDRVGQEFDRLGSFVESLSRRGETSAQSFERELEQLNAAFALGAIETAEEYERLFDVLAELHDPFGEAAEAARLDELRDDARQVIAEIEGVDLALEAHLASLEELHNEGMLTWEQYQAAVAMTVDEVERLEEQVDDSLTFAQEFGEEAARQLSRSLADFLFDPFEDGLTGMVTGFADAMARMAIDAAAANIVSGLFGAAGFSGGGPVQAFAAGGFVSGPGTSTSDSIPALLSDGEYVIDAKTTARFGAGYFAAHQDVARYASGGPVGSAPSGGAPINVAIFDNRQSADEWARSQRGRSTIVDAVDRGGPPV